MIKVLSPDFPKISMAMEISEGMTSAGVLEQFIKRQAAFASSENDDVLGELGYLFCCISCINL